MAEPSLTSTAEAIRDQMRQVRRELGEDVEGLVDNAQVLTDWRHYVRTYPWLCLGLAAAAGFLIVPARTQVVQPDAGTIAELVRKKQVVVSASTAAPDRPGLAATVGSLLASALLQGGLALLKRQLGARLDVPLHKPHQAASNGKDGAP